MGRQIIHLTVEELEAFRELPAEWLKAYLYLRRFVDARGIVGTKRTISRQAIREWLEVPESQGRHAEHARRITVKGVRHILEQLKRHGLIKQMPAERRLVFFLPMATTGQVRPKYEGPMRGREEGPKEGPTAERATPRNHNENMRLAADEGPDEGPTAPRDEGPTSPITYKNDSPPLGGSPPLTNRRESVAHRKRGSRLPHNWEPSERMIAFCRQRRPDLDPHAVAERFRDYWVAQPGQKGVKLDWEATWRNWVRRERAEPRTNLRVIPGARPMPGEQTRAAIQQAIEDFNRRNGGLT